MSTIRVIREYRTSYGSRDNVSEHELWIGTDVNELSRKYPPSDIMGADELGYNQFEDGCLTQDARFEQQLEDGSWETIDDPRVRLGSSLSDYERDIDAQNRRLFPGDYLDEDDDGYYNDWDM